jgi:hypothetical protein
MDKSATILAGGLIGNKWFNATPLFLGLAVTTAPRLEVIVL